VASRKGSLTALSFNCVSQELDNIILVKDNGLPADLTSKDYFGCVSLRQAWHLFGLQD
jgi:hypothetical protein